MSSMPSGRHAFVVALFAVSAVVVPSARAQRPGGAPSSGGASSSGTVPGSVGSTTGSSSSSYPGSRTFPGSASNPNVWQNSRPIFLSGKVLFADGTKLNSDIRVERVCGGMARLEGHTDSKGQFSFQVGQNAGVDTDAADQGTGGYGRPGANIGNPGVGTLENGRTTTGGNALWNCELRASYPGYRSDLIELGSHRSTDDPNVGTIILHPLGGSAAGTISLTTALVPKRAQKDYDKGVDLALKGKLEEAEKRFEAATNAYPKYAIAWFALGQIQQREGNTEGARKSYEAAIAADAKYASPYDQLARLSGQAEDWEAAARYSQQAVTLDTVDFPTSLWYNGLANYQLRKPKEAEKSLRELLHLDTAHRFPEAERMYAQLLMSEGSYAEAVTHLHTYLAIVPNGEGAVAAKELLAKLDQAQAVPPK